MTALPRITLAFDAEQTWWSRQRLALADVARMLVLWRLVVTLSWLDLRLRYRGSMLGPFWLTLSTAVMIAALGIVYSALFSIPLHDYLPFLALSLVLWNGLAATLSDACTSFIQAEAMVRAMRMPFTVHAARTVLRNVIVLAHNIPVVLAVYLIFGLWPGAVGLLAIPALLLWIADGMAACLLLGAICARFRDIPPIIASVIQIAFFLSAVIWQPSQLSEHAYLLPLNPFFSLLEVLRAPLLGQLPSAWAWEAALAYSVVFCGAAWLLFARARARIAFWV